MYDDEKNPFVLVLLFLLLSSSRHIMRYGTPLHYVQLSPLIPSEQQLNVSSRSRTSTSKNPLVVICPVRWSVDSAAPCHQYHEETRHFPALLRSCFYELFFPSGREMSQISLVHYQPKINHCRPRPLTCDFSFIFVICKHDHLSCFKIMLPRKAAL